MSKIRTAEPCQAQADNLAPSNRYTIGDLARLAQCTLRAVRFYEQQGLLAVNRRTTGHHRRYDDGALQRLRLVLELRRAELSVDEIRSIVEVKRRHAVLGAASIELRRILDVKIPKLGERIRELERLTTHLQALRDLLRTCEDCQCAEGSRSACATCNRVPRPAADLPLFRALWSHSE